MKITELKTENFKQFEKVVEENKTKIEKYFDDNFVIGMGLNLYHYLSSVIKYELIKEEKYEPIMDKYMTEEFLTENFSHVFDNCFYYKEGNHNNEGRIYENFKKEILLNIIQKEVKDNASEEVVSFVKEKYNKLMNWFEPIFYGQELYTTDNEEAFEMYELYYMEEEETVVFHTGGGKPFLFKKTSTFEEFFNTLTDGYIEKTEKRKEIQKEIKETEKKLSTKQRIMIKSVFGVGNTEDLFKKLNLYHERKKIDDVSLEEIADKSKKVIKLLNAMERLQKEDNLIENIWFEKNEINVQFDRYVRITLNEKTKSYYRVIKNEKEKAEFKTVFAKKIEKLSNEMHNVKVKVQPTFKNEDIQLELSFQTTGNLKKFRREIKKENEYYQYKDRTMKNMNEVYRFIESYVSELARRLELSRKNAQEFFLSNLTKKEEDIYQEHGFVEIESEERVYLLKKRKELGTYHILVVWDKGDEELKTAKCYCIERVQKQLEEYDEMASVLLALKAKEFSYIEENANKFKINEKTKKEIKERYRTVKEIQQKII